MNIRWTQEGFQILLKLLKEPTQRDSETHIPEPGDNN